MGGRSLLVGSQRPYVLKRGVQTHAVGSSGCRATREWSGKVGMDVRPPIRDNAYLAERCGRAILRTTRNTGPERRALAPGLAVPVGEYYSYPMRE